MAGPLSSLRAGKEVCDDRSLSRSLRRRNSLSVGIECHARGRVSKEFLHYLYVRSTCLQQRGIRMSKGMPAYPFGDAHLNRSRPDVMAQEGLSPEWELPLADRTGENLLT